MSREVPEGWGFPAIGSLGRIVTGKTPPTADDNLWNGSIPFVTPSDLNGSLYAGETTRAVTHKGLSYCKMVPQKSILVTCIASIGKMAISTGDCVTNQQINSVVPNDPADAEFLYYALQYRLPDLQNLAGKTAVPIVNKSLFSNFAIPLPPASERRRIAEILSSTDKAIAATRAVIEQTRKVKQGVLERLLTKGIGHSRFKQTQIGEIPEGWRIGTLGSIALGLEAGVSVNSENRPKQPGEIGILKTSCVSAGIFDPDEHKTVLLGERDRVKIPVRGDRIIISRMNTPNLVGANGYVENDIGDLFLPDRLWQLSTSENARWLACLLASDQSRERLSAIATGTSGSMKNISKSKLLDLLFAIPSQAEQQEIASIIQEIDTSIEANSRTLKGQIATKSALMSDLLTGRKRVTDVLPMAAE